MFVACSCDDALHLSLAIDVAWARLRTRAPKLVQHIWAAHAGSSHSDSLHVSPATALLTHKSNELYHTPRAGMGAGELAQDADCFPIRGQVRHIDVASPERRGQHALLVRHEAALCFNERSGGATRAWGCAQVRRVCAPWIKHAAFLNDSHYVIPNVGSVVVGGTQQSGDGREEVCDDDTARIWEVATRTWPALTHAEVIKDWVRVWLCFCDLVTNGYVRPLTVLFGTDGCAALPEDACAMCVHVFKVAKCAC